METRVSGPHLEHEQPGLSAPPSATAAPNTWPAGAGRISSRDLNLFFCGGGSFRVPCFWEFQSKPMESKPISLFVLLRVPFLGCFF